MHRDLRGAAARGLLLDGAQHGDPAAFDGAHQAAALAVRAGDEALLGERGAQALAAHLQQAEMADAADLDARAVMAQRVLHPLLDERVVLRAFHVDEVHDDKAREVAQAQLARHLVGRFQVGLERRVLDVPLARGAARVHVDGDQRLGLVDDEVAARFQLHDGLVHRVELRLGAVAAEQGLRPVPVGLDLADLVRHQHADEVAHGGVGFVALDQDLVHLLRGAVAHAALDEVRLLVDQRRGGGGERALADPVPELQQVLAVAPDLGLGAVRAGGAHDQRHAVGHLDLVDHLAQAAAVGRGGDLAADAPAARRVGHQHGEAAGQRDVGGERRALVAALLLDDLHQKNLAAADDLLDLVAAEEARGGAAGAVVLDRLRAALGAAVALGPAERLGERRVVLRDLLDAAVRLGVGVAVGEARIHRRGLGRGRPDGRGGAKQALFAGVGGRRGLDLRGAGFGRGGRGDVLRALGPAV